MLSAKSFVSRAEASAPGHQNSKERPTIMAYTNAAGNHKLTLMLIGKSAKPTVLKNENYVLLSETKRIVNEFFFI